MEQIVEQGMLYDFYGPLLTKHQQEVYELVVYQNLSLNEIAEQKNISKQLEHAINERETIVAGKDDKQFVPITADEIEGVTAEVVTPILCEGDAIGAVAILSREPRAKFGDMELKLAGTAAGFLGRQMEG